MFGKLSPAAITEEVPSSVSSLTMLPVNGCGGVGVVHMLTK